jgi:inhibitor of KinA
MMGYQINFRSFGEQTLLIQWPNTINEDINLDIIGFNYKIINKFSSCIVETVISYCSLTVYLKENIKMNELIEELKQLYNSRHEVQEILATIWNIPVCYDLEFGLDLFELANSKSMAIYDLVQIHTQAIYHVYFLGFLPGFAYLGGLDSELFSPRLSSPRVTIPKGSVAIGGQQTGIYPTNSPGGWNIIGRTPIQMFDLNRNPPVFLKAGDKVKFVAIDLNKYLNILDQVSHAKFNYEELKND